MAARKTARSAKPPAPAPAPAPCKSCKGSGEVTIEVRVGRGRRATGHHQIGLCPDCLGGGQ